MIYKNYEQIIRQIQHQSRASRVALAAAEDGHSLEAVLLASREKIIQPVLVGDGEKIAALLRGLGENPGDYEIVAASPQQSAWQAVELVRNGQADFLMKGKLETATLLKAVVDQKHGLQAGQLISHVTFLEVPSYHKLLVITDAGMVPYPDLQQKQQIVQNVVTILKKMDFDPPKIAVLAGVERVNPKMQETLDGAELERLNASGALPDCTIVGPISYDLAMSQQAAEIKEYACPHCGQFDVLLVPNLATGNILSKALILNAGATMAGMVVGAAVPIVLSSRGASTQEKYLSLVLCAAAAQRSAGAGGSGV